MFRHVFKKTKVKTVFIMMVPKIKLDKDGFCYEIITTQEDLFCTKHADIPLIEGVDLIVNKTLLGTRW